MFLSVLRCFFPQMGHLLGGTAYSRWFSVLSTLLLVHFGVHLRLLGFAMVPSPLEEGSSRPIGDTACPDPSLSWLLPNSWSLWSPHLPARITVYWVLLGLMSYVLAPCQDTYHPLRVALSRLMTDLHQHTKSQLAEIAQLPSGSVWWAPGPGFSPSRPGTA